MDSQLTLYCIRNKFSGNCLLRSDSRTLPMFFACPHRARAALTNRVKRTGELKREFDIVPVYMTISALNVDDIADLDMADADIKQRIKQLGLTCVRGGK